MHFTGRNGEKLAMTLVAEERGAARDGRPDMDPRRNRIVEVGPVAAAARSHFAANGREAGPSRCLRCRCCATTRAVGCAPSTRRS